MVVGVCVMELHLPGCRSLKDKRRVVKSVVERLRPRFNVAVAEVGLHDVWNQAELGICTVADNGSFVDEVLAKVIREVEGDGRVVISRVTTEKV